MITMVTGPMFSGKSNHLINMAAHAGREKIPFIAFKPAKDKRYAVDEIVSHDGRRIEAYRVESAGSIRGIIKRHRSEGLTCVAIDEAQFFELDLVDLLNEYHTEPINFLVACLDLDSDGKPWETSIQIMAIADMVHKIAGQCAVCHMPSTRSQRLSSDKTRELVGGAKEYSPRCLHHWSPGPEVQEEG